MQTRRIGILGITWALLLLLAAAPSAALDLESAKRAGALGERADGFVGAVQANPTAEVAALVKEVNEKRRAHYAEIAKRNNVPIDAVAREAGRKLIERAAPGHWVTDEEGRWYQK
jgi:uncharacterized protein